MQADEDVCDNEANKWRICIEQELGKATASATCANDKAVFDQCITQWRARVGPSVQIKGKNEGEPADQCAAMSCLIGECLRKYNYDFKRCELPMGCFKHCVKSFYGSEYIDR
ncbi:hypothetical protein AGDE_00202 [Angomonas deanei]|uniref:Uncharacterized protein n=1 Tax=Angomonas deanei TaxID=59799 RepID=S9UQR3_9TRYP|nr:hypothetical protein AGDE_09221 [Angomonas deanei]EPY43719.1 hypothetical protein AGDE_00202 [Angomonas deanei]CAD2216393.1 hypothetical protein, conserved [Angomonas deanei]|eukprot:EPY31104.1 hypothetical protein AGDE_09221 [Angomonas deanei]